MSNVVKTVLKICAIITSHDPYKITYVLFTDIFKKIELSIHKNTLCGINDTYIFGRQDSLKQFL